MRPYPSVMVPVPTWTSNGEFWEVVNRFEGRGRIKKGKYLTVKFSLRYGTV